MTSVSGASAYSSLNQILASSTAGGFSAVRAARIADNSVRAEAQQLAQQAGPNAQTTTQIRYSVGPDGQLYASGARVTTTERGEDVRDPLRLQRGGEQLLQPSALQPTDQQLLARRPQSLADVLQPRPLLSPADETALFSTVDNGQDDIQFTLYRPYDSAAFRAEAAGTVDLLNRSRLQVADFGVRAQEAQHFRAAAGLGALPEFTLQAGPDGELFAVGGSVAISSTPTTDPERAARDASTVARAALAATDVSAQDISVARNAQSQAASLYAQNNTIVDQESPAILIAA